MYLNLKNLQGQNKNNLLKTDSQNETNTDK